MNVDPRKTNLMLFLNDRDPLLWGKVVELRDRISDWLSYIPETFPHYTRHTVVHSDAIISQLSKLLFQEEESVQPVIKLSGMEAYILAVASYMHDTGMVVSNAEKQKILESEGWREWVSQEGIGGRRWREIEALRKGPIPAESAVRNFLADLETRFLMAEFIRRTHHFRAQVFMTQLSEHLPQFAFQDPMLMRAIANVCIAHGLPQSELQDRDRYPDRTDIQEQQVNLRFLAILLRLGDLLDLSTDRACSLLLNAACPLPAESLAHWSQYKRIVRRLTSPDRIEIVAQCETQEEHRALKDWCEWIVQEIRNAAVTMARSERHRDWQPPIATIDCSEATIRIEPAPNASYIPSNWRFELDEDMVFRRLIHDLYVEPKSFVRELIQNALDATRCQMYLDLRDESEETPDSPTQVPEVRRQRYPVKLALSTIDVISPLSGEVEKRQVLAFEDVGIGMDREILQRYLLQIGRSYYTTYDFQKNFKFVPTSRFGTGFLSVFNVSDHISIETYKPSTSALLGPLHLVLTGPRNYLLLEKGRRTQTGTCVKVFLRESFNPGELTRLVSSWCRRVEFPILVDDLGTHSIIVAERKEQFTYEIPDPTDTRARYAVRAFDVDRQDIQGELYVFARIDQEGERWDAWSHANYAAPGKDPRASKPAFPASLRCIHGISVGNDRDGGPTGERLDFRGSNIPRAALSRDVIRVSREEQDDSSRSRLRSRWTEVIADHLATSRRANSPTGWRYKQAMVDYFHAPEFGPHYRK
jgi:molecular chaperone HtpG